MHSSSSSRDTPDNLAYGLARRASLRPCRFIISDNEVHCLSRCKGGHAAERVANQVNRIQEER